jgi:zona occludens toxin (predicted ATPase)
VSEYFMSDVFVADGLLPASVAVCPECGGRIQIEIDEVEAATGIPTPGGYVLLCAEDAMVLHDYGWRHYGAQWDALTVRVHPWIVAHVRSPELSAAAERRKLAAWNAWAKGQTA